MMYGILTTLCMAVFICFVIEHRRESARRARFKAHQDYLLAQYKRDAAAKLHDKHSETR